MSFGGGGTISTTEPKIGALSIQNSAFGLPVPLFWGKSRLTFNLMWYGDFTAISHTTQQASGGKGGGGVAMQNTTFTYSAAFIGGLSEGQISSIDQVWAGKEKTTFAALGMTLLTGTLPQAVWGHLTTNHPTEALSYPGIAAVAHSAFNLGNSASLPNLSFECNGPRQFGSGIVDARPDEIVTDMLSSAICGAGFPAARLSLAVYRTYTQANGLFLSPYINSQQPAAMHLEELLEATNSEPLWSEGLLKILPYGDSVVTGNGTTYTPAIAPQYDLTDDDFFPAAGELPIVIRRKPQADAYNHVQVEFRNRANEYNIEIAPAKDQGNIGAFGLRTMEPVRLHSIHDTAVANQVANAILQRRLYIRNEYEFRLCWRHCLLEPMDIVTLTHAALGLDLFQVRIKSIEEDEYGMLRVVAEEFPFGVATPALIQTQQPSGYSVDFNVSPGSANAPVIFEPPMSLAGQGRYELWLATSGGVNWGSAEVWVSWDDATYKRVGVVQGGARHGALSAAIASWSGPAPDTINTLAVDLSVSRGELISGTLADRDDLHTLCYVDGELVSYQTATLTAANKYNLTSMRRGAHGTTIAAHAISSKFVRLDDAVFQYAYEAADIGKTLYIKLRSLNTFDSGIEELATLTAYTHTIVGAAEGVAVPPPDVNTFLVSRQPDGTRQFTWTLLNPPADITGYVVRYKLGTATDWATMTSMHDGLLLASPFESNQLAAGTYTFAIKAVDMFGNESVNAAFINATLGDPRLAGALEVFSEWADGWPGTKTGCHVDSPDGFLQPNETAATPWTGTWAGRTWLKTPAASITYERL
ncbi:MAG: phage tail protein, partial [Burkholderiaceae bacterium]|nr:phage tail protein [Burkholderiaceae bacterium]